jgi:hypothetical protein
MSTSAATICCTTEQKWQYCHFCSVDCHVCSVVQQSHKRVISQYSPSAIEHCKTAILRRNVHFGAIYSAAAAHVQASGVPTPMGASDVPGVLCCLSGGSSVKPGNSFIKMLHLVAAACQAVTRPTSH